MTVRQDAAPQEVREGLARARRVGLMLPDQEDCDPTIMDDGSVMLYLTTRDWDMPQARTHN